MVINTTQELGELIGKSISQANDFKQDFIPTEEVVDLNIVGLQTVDVVGSFFVYEQDIGSAFHVDHPVNGVADDIYTYDEGDLGSRTLQTSGSL